jgi:nicotinamide mononucleotide transporter
MDTFIVLEILAAVCGVLCVCIQSQEKILAWPFGIISVFLYVFIFYETYLYSDVLLNATYVVLNIYGWWYWSTQKGENKEVVEIIQLDFKGYLIWLLAIFFGTIALGSFMGNVLGASLPYLDAFTTSGSLVAQYLLAKKVLQNWLLWIVVDIVAINMYIYKNMYITAALFVGYLLLCILGYSKWQKELRIASLEAND